MKDNKTISIREYLTKKGIQFIENGDELITKCIFSHCDDDSQEGEAHLYFSINTGQYECKKCGETGNIFTLAQFIDGNYDLILQSNNKENLKKEEVSKKIESSHQNIPGRIIKYLIERGIKKEIIEKYKIGYGKFYGKNWITIPIKDKQENYIFLKLREDPLTGNSKSTYPDGVNAQVYDWEILKENPEFMVICEGEFDRLVLISKGVSAITFTHGAGVFKEEWIEQLKNIKNIYVCYDNDEAGKRGANKLLATLKEKTNTKLYRISLPEIVGEKGDLTDYFINNLGTEDELFEKYSENYPKTIDISKLKEMYSDEIANVLEPTIKCDNENKITTFLCMLLTYTENDQFSIIFNSPSSTGKSHITTENSKFFPKEDVFEIGHCTPTAFFYDEDHGEFVEEFGGYIIDLSKKILIFLDQPQDLLLQRLRPILSHDKKEILMKMTDKTQKHGLKTKNVKLIGYPSVIFCTAGLNMDEQEATRSVLLSAENTNNKIEESIDMAIEVGADREKFEEELNKNYDRQLLRERIQSIKEQNFKEVVIKDKKRIKDMFYLERKVLKSRFPRDVKRVMSLIKAFALLNLWWRERKDSTIFANEKDIMEGFKIWNKISLCQELGLPPYLFNLFKGTICSAYEEKNILKDNEDKIGITRKEIMEKHIKIYGRPLSEAKLRQEILPILESAGLITQDNDLSDGRMKLVTPLLYFN